MWSKIPSLFYMAHSLHTVNNLQIDCELNKKRLENDNNDQDLFLSLFMKCSAR